jgi:hypothetical protein
MPTDKKRIVKELSECAKDEVGDADWQGARCAGGRSGRRQAGGPRVGRQAAQPAASGWKAGLLVGWQPGSQVLVARQPAGSLGT